MIRGWLAIGLLAVSWLFGQDYYQPPNRIVWGVLLVAAVALLSGRFGWRRIMGRRPLAISFGLLLVPAALSPWLDRAALVLLLAGIAVTLLPVPSRRLWHLGSGALAAGVILWAQSVAMVLYTAGTAWTHDLPRPLAWMLAYATRLLGIETAAADGYVVLQSMRQNHRLAATWDLLVDPVTLVLLVGGLVWLAILAWARPGRGGRFSGWALAAAKLLAVVSVWCVVRALLLIAVFLQRELRADYATPLHVMNHFFSAWTQLGLILVPVLLAWRFVPLDFDEESGSRPLEPVQPPQSRHPGKTAGALALVGLAASLWAVAGHWEPIGQRKPGRVAVVERHSDWEPTTRRYDTLSYGESSGYNYGAIYDYCGRYFQMGQILPTQPINDATLASWDVVFVKTPTEQYTTEEVEALVRFVEQGGGLMLLGEHTNHERCGTYLNHLARHFGFLFRYDLLFGSGVAYDQLYRRPRVPHPIVQYQPDTDFAVSCSIEPSWMPGRAAIESTGLWSLPPAYHTPNFFPLPYHTAEMRSGAFVQLWTTRFGRGRVAAFTDSTIFSNFCVFEPGKAELILGILQWLNYRNLLGDPHTWVLLVSFLPLIGALFLAWPRRTDWLVLVAVLWCGFAVGGQAAAALHRWAMPPLESKRPFTRVAIDRTVSDAPLTKSGFPQAGDAGYGILEQWIPRLGVFPARRSGESVFQSDVAVIITPRQSAAGFAERLTDYVRQGGNLLLVDSPENQESTSNGLLAPFGLALKTESKLEGTLKVEGAKANVPATKAWEVTGGRPVAQVDGRSVAVEAPFGKGKVLAVGCGSAWNDGNMGGSWIADPNASTRERYDVLFALLRRVIKAR